MNADFLCVKVGEINMNAKYASLLKQSYSIPISVILDHFKVKYDRSFSYLISCPIPSHIHQSNTPSFKVYKDTNSFYCFGCKAAGGPAHLTKHMLNSSLEEALNYLAKHFSLKTKSLTKSFLKSSLNISNNSKPSPILFAAVQYDKLLSLFSEIRRYPTSSIISKNLQHFYDKFYYQKMLYLNNLQDKDSFLDNCQELFREIENFKLSLKCQNMDYVRDAANLLELTTKL